MSKRKVIVIQYAFTSEASICFTSEVYFTTNKNIIHTMFLINKEEHRITSSKNIYLTTIKQYFV